MHTTHCALLAYFQDRRAVWGRACTAAETARDGARSDETDTDAPNARARARTDTPFASGVLASVLMKGGFGIRDAPRPPLDRGGWPPSRAGPLNDAAAASPPAAAPAETPSSSSVGVALKSAPMDGVGDRPRSLTPEDASGAGGGIMGTCAPPAGASGLPAEPGAGAATACDGDARPGLTVDELAAPRLGDTRARITLLLRRAYAISALASCDEFNAHHHTKTALTVSKDFNSATCCDIPATCNRHCPHTCNTQWLQKAHPELSFVRAFRLCECHLKLALQMIRPGLQLGHLRRM